MPCRIDIVSFLSHPEFSFIAANRLPIWVASRHSLSECIYHYTEN